MSDAPVGAFIRGIMIDLVPLFTVIVLILMTVMPHSLPAAARLGGLWPLTGIAFWTLARPRSMRLPIVFLLGLLVDIVTFVPFGLHAAVFVISRFILMKQRRFLLGQGFWVLWASFALLVLSAYTVLFFFTSFFLPSAISFMRGLIGVGIAWACLPLVVWVLARLHDMIDLFDDSIA